jgi:hypothetical protein
LWAGRWHTAALERVRQEDFKFKANLGYITRLFQKSKRKKKEFSYFTWHIVSTQ